MNFKFLFKRLWCIVVAPHDEWEAIMTESPRQDVASAFVYPLTMLCGTAVLLGRLTRDGFAEGGWWMALSQACIVSLGLMVCYWLTAMGANELRSRYLHIDSDMPACYTLTGYAMTVNFLLTLFTGLFPEMVIFRYVLQFYVVYVVWQGAEVVMKVEENRRMTYALLVSALLLLIPYIFNFIFSKLSSIAV